MNSTLAVDNVTVLGGSLRWCSVPQCAALQVRVLSVVIATFTLLIHPMAIYLIIKTPELRGSFTGILMANMCLSGVIPSLFNGLLSFCNATHSLFVRPVTCVIAAIIANTNVLVTLTSIAAMAVDRFIAISIPLRYGQVVTTRKILTFIVLQWLCCILTMCVPLLEKEIIWCVKRYAGCGFQNSKYSTLVMLVVIYIPSITAIIISYSKILHLVHQMSLRQVRGRRRKERLAGIRTTVLVLVTFVIYSLPMTVYATMHLQSTRDHVHVLLFQDISTLLLFTGPLINTLTYGSTNKTFKSALVKLLRHLFNLPASSAKVSPTTITVASISTTI